MNSPTRRTLQIPADHPAYAGHFPALPVLPGAVLLDTALAAVQEARQIDVTQWQLGVAKFLSVVRPGEPLELEHEMTDKDVIRFTIRSSQRAVATGMLSRKAQVPPA